MKRFHAPPENFTENSDNTKAVLGLEETRHLRDVLRLREGEKVRVFSGAGSEFLCEIEKIEKLRTVLRVLHKVSDFIAEPDLNLMLAVALLKGEKFDLIVQKASELGVSRIVPVQTKRADIKLKDATDAEKKLERWRRIALEAAKQCGRTTLLQIESPVLFETFIENCKGTRILFAERDGDDNFKSFSAREDISEITAVVGSEGGWETAEIEAARVQGFHIITLGGRILRAETAAIVAAALLQNRFGDLR
jgi:16S rRNA (uracil1498-N3)-methyltransferase